ncbi:hypothetical protein [Amycolatopsis regifaucium]|nr:hypothetical protein [Amycolatopsis regifaucium]
MTDTPVTGSRSSVPSRTPAVRGKAAGALRDGSSQSPWRTSSPS